MGAIQIAIGLMEKAVALPGEKAKVIEKDASSSLDDTLVFSTLFTFSLERLSRVASLSLTLFLTQSAPFFALGTLSSPEGPTLTQKREI